MKFHFIACIIFSIPILTNQGYAQESPDVQLINEHIEVSHLPAFSVVQNTVALVHQDYSCCITTDAILLQIDALALSLINEIIFDPGEESDKNYTLEQKHKIVSMIEELFKDRSYTSMIEIDSFSVLHDAVSSINYVELFVQQSAYKSESFVLPELKQPLFCCQNDVDQASCVEPSKIHKIWTIEDHSMLLIQYGILHQTNGCDQGPLYLILGLESK